MKKVILVALIVFSATQAIAQKKMIEKNIEVFDVEIRTPGVNLNKNLMYIKTDLDNCAWEGRLAFPMTKVGSKAFDVARELHKDEELIRRLVYDVSKVVQTEEGPKDVCWGTNVRKP